MSVNITIIELLIVRVYIKESTKSRQMINVASSKSFRIHRRETDTRGKSIPHDMCLVLFENAAASEKPPQKNIGTSGDVAVDAEAIKNSYCCRG